MALPLVLRRNAKFRSILQQTVRNAALWNHEWRPGPVPQTEEERVAAARKYGLIPADYDTYPDDGTGFGDYPKLEPIGADSRDPHALYDVPELKRNFGEPMHVDGDMFGEDRLDVSVRLRFSLLWKLTTFLGCMFGGFGLYLLSENFRITCLKMMPRHYPSRIQQEGKTFYSFDIVKPDEEGAAKEKC